MANSYFQFKQFTIHQDQCAMKVCTDACVLGAWFAAKVPDFSTILDIGSGTGLLMMMLAQKTGSDIHGIEIDLSAFKQLKENINQNSWKERFRIFPGDARTYTFPAKYDFIISNPPFFENDLPSATDEEQVAKHSKSLKLDELLEVINTNLDPFGAFGILLPYHRWEYFHQLAAANGFSLVENLLVKQSPQHPFFRSILHYSRSKENFSPLHELVIKGEDGAYTEDFTELMKDYYLHL
ncbi:MAG: methyltransferase [Candidatus Pseudobacter hemicellulosilyticus]|uniref:tRNA1(Val) (adenine(37)-N6)-methyltransferase n=1 Tax=Candidatus Pseudobacter hemicellulosilyticus TaxID=3121375 RepID=A0AAJ5WTD6_9BACT|nr:MAG: methyltransferase [Pseudobacter sp.]